jgi:hypothetical protein
LRPNSQFILAAGDHGLGRGGMRHLLTACPGLVGGSRPTGAVEWYRNHNPSFLQIKPVFEATFRMR